MHLGEYLYKWKTVALPLLGSEWELRYWALSGTTLSYYRSAKDTAFSPREEFSVMVRQKSSASLSCCAGGAVGGGGGRGGNGESVWKQSSQRLRVCCMFIFVPSIWINVPCKDA